LRPTDDLIKLATFDQFHAEIAGTITLAHFVDRDDAWMIETGGGLRFAAKSYFGQTRDTNFTNLHQLIE